MEFPQGGFSYGIILRYAGDQGERFIEPFKSFNNSGNFQRSKNTFNIESTNY